MDNEIVTAPPAEQSRHAPVSAVMVAGDAGATVARAIESILAQTRAPERVLVVVAGSRDDTFRAARTFNGRHDHAETDAGTGCASTTVTVIDRGPREDSRRSAFDFALRLVPDGARVLLVTPDADLDERVLELLTAELDGDERLGMAAARLESRPSGSRGPIAGALRLLQRHWAVGAVETGADLGVTGPVPLAPATLLRTAPRSTPTAAEDDALSRILTGRGRIRVVPAARARVDTAVTWDTMRARRDRWGAYVRRFTRPGGGASPADRRRAALAALRIEVGPVLRVTAFALVAVYAAAAALRGTLDPQWWWAVPVAVRLPLQIRTLLRIRERDLADTAFGATHLPLEIGEMAYGVSRIRATLRRVAPRSLQNPVPQGRTHPVGGADAVAVVLLLLVVGAVLGLAATGGDWGAALTTDLGWLACLVTTADVVTALLRLLARRRAPRRRPDPRADAHVA